MLHEVPDGFEGVIGLLRSMDDGTETYWVRWDDGPGRYRLPMGPRLEGESFVATAEREIAWTFDLDPTRDLVVSTVPRLHHVAASPESEGRCTIEFFVADPYGPGRRTVRADSRNRAATRRELLAGIVDGAVFDPVQRALLIGSDVLPRTGA